MITMFRSLLCVWMTKNYEGELVLKEYLKFKENTSLMSKSVKNCYNRGWRHIQSIVQYYFLNLQIININ